MTDNHSSGGSPRTRRFNASWWASIATVVAALITLGAWWFPRSSDGPPAGGGGFSTRSEGPLSVAMIHGGQAPDCPTLFFLPQGIDEVGAAVPRDDGDSGDTYLDSVEGWVTSVGGWRATNHIQFSVEGNLARATILTGIRINLVSRKPLTSRTELAFGECGGVEEVRYFSVDFTPTRPRLRALPSDRMNEDGTLVPVEPVEFPFTVSETDPEIFDLMVEPGPVCDCQWTATLRYTQSGRSYATTIDDGGKPFHAVPTDEVPAYSIYDGTLQRVEE